MAPSRRPADPIAQQSVARTRVASKDIDLVDGHHAHVVQPPGLLVRVTFSQDDADT